jgi:hypothetical protein
MSAARSALIAVAAASALAVTACGKSSTVVSADALPLFHGATLRAERARKGVEKGGGYNQLLIAGPRGRSRQSLLRREVSHLRRLRWRFPRRFGDGSRAAYSPGGEVFSDLGYRCFAQRTRALERRSFPVMCASLTRAR